MIFLILSKSGRLLKAAIIAMEKLKEENRQLYDSPE
jgi:hypothetical protein